MDGTEALERLMAGNSRYASGSPEGPNRTTERRDEVATDQNPFAVVLTCSDSRVVPELIFDAGIGDLFVIKTAGNVADDVVIGSIEFAIDRLGTRLIMVLGHTSCGAVGAALEGGVHPGNTGTVVHAIAPSVAAVIGSENVYADAIVENVRRMVERITGSGPIIPPRVQNEEVTVVGALYDMASGVVEPVQPRQ